MTEPDEAGVEAEAVKAGRVARRGSPCPVCKSTRPPAGRECYWTASRKVRCSKGGPGWTEIGHARQGMRIYEETARPEPEPADDVPAEVLDAAPPPYTLGRHPAPAAERNGTPDPVLEAAKIRAKVRSLHDLPPAPREIRKALEAKYDRIGRDTGRDPLQLARDRLNEYLSLGYDPDGGPSPALAAHQEQQAKFKFTDSKEFLAGDYRQEFLVKRVLVRGQPLVIGGPQKTLKTSLLVDLGVSLATATPFLGEFAVPRRVRAALVSGESGEFTLKETCLRVLRARGVDPGELAGWLKWNFTLPTVTDLVEMSHFARRLAELEVEIVIIDPFYLCLGEVDARNVFDMGKALRPVAEFLLSKGITPAIAHHANRMLPVGDVMELSHLSYAGLAEFARQWVLLNRREKYKHDGNHDLWLSVGGSVGHGGLWNLHVAEGLQNDDFSGRKWDVTVDTATDTRTAEAADREATRREAKRVEHEQDERAVRAAIEQGDGEASAVTAKEIRERTGFSHDRASGAIRRLRDAGAIFKEQTVRECGRGRTQQVDGYRIAPD
jgi:hypothetical protein